MINIKFLRQHTPRWVILFIDLFISLLSILLAYYLRLNFNFFDQYLQTFIYVLPIVFLVRLLSFLISGTYTGLVRHTSTKDAVKIFMVILVGSVTFAIISLVSYLIDEIYIIPLSVIAIDFFIVVFLLIASRLFIKTIYLEYIASTKQSENIIIYGADEFSLATKRTLERDIDTHYKIVAFIEDNETKGSQKIDGVKVYYYQDIEDVIEKYKVTNLIITQKKYSIKKQQFVIDTCLNKNIKIYRVPKLDQWINGELSFNQIRKINIEDLLERDPIKLDEQQISKEIVNKVVLVTGAAGSIGSEIVKQITRFNPKMIIAFDQAESPLYDLELELRESYKYYNFEIVIGDVTNSIRVNKMFEAFAPTVVFHAAAYKHVPMMENNPSEAVRTNVLGTKVLADLSVKHNVKKFVMISTDKAVNPTNVMGASKRIAEMYTQSLNKMVDTKFITTRFGNVLGSNGSVIPRFKRQIESGGPVTVTHPDVTRYFMTIPEACQLVLEASAFGKGGEVFIFDMGKSVKIVDLAKKMIKLYGLSLGRDIEIKFTGLRPGEKLYEELLNDKENTMPTHHSQIMIGKVKEYNFNSLSTEILKMLGSLKNHDNFEIVGFMKRIVPEFKSKNSIYEELDQNVVLADNTNFEIKKENIKNDINKDTIEVNQNKFNRISLIQ